jgi:2-dehydropantoate 2-reductase
MAFEKLAVFGAGAIGSTLGAYLARAGQDITLIDMWAPHVEEMQHRGLKVTAPDEEFTVKVKAVHLADACALHELFDVIFLSVKSYDSEWAVRFIRPYLKPAGILVSAQNGVNEDLLAPAIGYTRLIGCVVTLGAGLNEPGHVNRTTISSRHSLTLGEMNGMLTSRLQELVKVMAAVGPAKATANLWGERWAKLIVNSMANPIAGITGLGSAELRARAEVFPIIVRIACEALTVAEVLGVPVEPISGISGREYLDAGRGEGVQELRDKLIEAGRNLRAGRPSLLQDITKGRRTEVEHLNGYVARRGRELGVPTPMNEAVVQVVKQVESGKLKQDPANLNLLTKYLYL